MVLIDNNYIGIERVRRTVVRAIYGIICRSSSKIVIFIFFMFQLTLPEGYLSVVMSDLAGSRRAQVLELKDNGDMKLISAHIPVASLAVCLYII